MEPAVAICYRNKHIMKELYQENRWIVEDCIRDRNFMILNNPLQTNLFEPSSPDMIKLADFGLKRGDIITLGG